MVVLVIMVLMVYNVFYTVGKFLTFYKATKVKGASKIKNAVTYWDGQICCCKGGAVSLCSPRAAESARTAPAAY